MKRNVLVAVVGACVFACVVGLGGAAMAWGDGDEEKDIPPASVAADVEEAGLPAGFWERNSRLGVVAGDIEELVDPTESGRPTLPGVDGYLMVKVDLQMDIVELFWKGEVPAKVRSVIDAHPDVQVRIHRAAYSEIQYMDAQDALVALTQEALAEAEGDAQLIGITHVGDREGFQVILFDPDRVVSVPDLLRGYGKAGVLDLPIQVEYSKKKQMSLAQRA